MLHIFKKCYVVVVFIVLFCFFLKKKRLNHSKYTDLPVVISRRMADRGTGDKSRCDSYHGDM